MKDIYQNLISELCAAVNLPHLDEILNSARFEVDGVGFSVRHDNGSPDIMLVYADFGPMPGKDNDAIYHKLLEENFTTAIGSTGYSTGSFSMAPKSKSIVYISALELDKTTVRTLVFHLGRTSDLAKKWRSTHYVGDGATAATGQHGSHSLKLDANRGA